MTSLPQRTVRRPVLVSHARLRWDDLRNQYHIVYPEGLLVLNTSAAAIVRLCDGRSTDEIVNVLRVENVSNGETADDVVEFLMRLVQKGLLRDADDA